MREHVRAARDFARHLSAHSHIRTRLYVVMHILIHLLVGRSTNHARAHTHISLHMSTCACPCMCTHIHTHTSVWVHIFIHVRCSTAHRTTADTSLRRRFQTSSLVQSLRCVLAHAMLRQSALVQEAARQSTMGARMIIQPQTSPSHSSCGTN